MPPAKGTGAQKMSLSGATQKAPLDLPSLSEKDWSKEEEEEDYFWDPESEQDSLPQPFRMISKLVDSLFDRTWAVIQQKDILQDAQLGREQPVTYAPTAESKEYLFLGGAKGFCIYHLFSGKRLYAWEKLKVAVTAIWAMDLDIETLLLLLDETGVLRLFYLCRDSLYFIKAINDAEDASKQAACVKVQLSLGGDFAAFLLQAAGDLWLEVYKLPREAWLKEVEHPQMSANSKKKNKQLHLSITDTLVPEAVDTESSVSYKTDVKLSPPVLIMKLKPPKPVTGTTFKSPLEVFARVEDSASLGWGQNHYIKETQWEQEVARFHAAYKGFLYWEREDEPLSMATFHFLPYSSLVSLPPDAKSHPGASCLLGLHWVGRHNFYFFSLTRSLKDKADPDSVWPFAAPIIMSQLSHTRTYLVVACEDGVLTLWDIHEGLSLGVVALPEGCVCQSLHYMKYFAVHHGRCVFPDALLKSQVRCAVLCTDASLHLLSAKGTQDLAIHVIVDRPDKFPDEAICDVAPIRTLPGMLLTFSKKGLVQLLDVAAARVVCAFALPAPQLLPIPWKPMFVVLSQQPFFLIQGAYVDEASGHTQHSVFHFDLHTYPLLGSLLGASTVSQEDLQESAASGQLLSLEKRCELLLQKSFRELEANKEMEEQQWLRLRQYSLVLQKENRK